MPENAWNAFKNWTARGWRKVRTVFSQNKGALPPAPTPPASVYLLDLRQVANPLFSGTETTPGAVYQQGAWTLAVYYRNRGSRSQGQHGVLFKDGVEVMPSQAGEILQTDLGDLIYKLNPEEMTLLWDITGWTFAG